MLKHGGQYSNPFLVVILKILLGFISIQHKTLQLEDDAHNISIGVRREAIAAHLSPLPSRLLPGVDAVRHREDEGQSKSLWFSNGSMEPPDQRMAKMSSSCSSSTSVTKLYAIFQ